MKLFVVTFQALGIFSFFPSCVHQNKYHWNCRSLNQEFIWSEALEGWVKAQKASYANATAAPQFKVSGNQLRNMPK
jgi:uncharacterized GH25 family protein